MTDNQEVKDGEEIIRLGISKGGAGEQRMKIMILPEQNEIFEDCNITITIKDETKMEDGLVDLFDIMSKVSGAWDMFANPKFFREINDRSGE